jgi:hypothetical protein
MKITAKKLELKNLTLAPIIWVIAAIAAGSWVVENIS